MHAANIGVIILTLEFVNINFVLLRTRYLPLERPVLANFLPQECTTPSRTTIEAYQIPAFNMIAFHVANIYVDGEENGIPLAVSV